MIDPVCTCGKTSDGVCPRCGQNPTQETDFDITLRLLDAAEEPDGVRALPVLHNPGLIILLFDGWAVRLKADGTWAFEDTTGG